MGMLPSFHCLDLARLYEQYNKREGNLLGERERREIPWVLRTKRKTEFLKSCRAKVRGFWAVQVSNGWEMHIDPVSLRRSTRLVRKNISRETGKNESISFSIFQRRRIWRRLETLHRRWVISIYAIVLLIFIVLLAVNWVDTISDNQDMHAWLKGFPAMMSKAQFR